MEKNNIDVDKIEMFSTQYLEKLDKRIQKIECEDPEKLRHKIAVESMDFLHKITKKIKRRKKEQRYAVIVVFLKIMESLGRGPAPMEIYS